MADVPVVDPSDLGRGIKRDNAKKKFEVDLTDYVDGTTVTYENGKLSAQTSGGLDCSAIGELKTVAMDKTVKVLGKKDDECVQVAVLDSIFQDVGVGLSASKYSGFVGDSFNVKVTVSNTGEGTNENTTLTIIKPALGNYTISNQTHTSQGVEEVTKVSDTEYRISNIAKGGTVIVTFDVLGNSHGSYQFSATVDPNSALDTNADNHQATISLNVNTRADVNYVPTLDCPLITAVDMETNTQLLVRAVPPENSPAGRENGNGKAFNQYDKTRAHNIYWNKDSLTGVRIKLENAYTVSMSGIANKDNAKAGFELNGRRTSAGFWNHYDELGIINPENQLLIKTSLSANDYTFDTATGILSITKENLDRAVIWARPSGVNCHWQAIVLQTTTPISGCVLDITPKTGVEINSSASEDQHNEFVAATLHIGATGEPTNRRVSSVNQRAEILVPERTARTYTITSSTCDLYNHEQSGNVAIDFSRPNNTPTLTVNIKDTATISDSVSRRLVDVKIGT